MHLDIVTAPKRNSYHWSPGSITWEELIEWCAKPAAVKESGSYILGTLAETTTTHKPPNREPWECTDIHRTKMAVISRSALTLDVDHPVDGFALDAAMEIGSAALIHTTHSSTPSEPRYRIIIPLNRSVSPDEYHAAATAMMQRLGEESFDPGSVQPERYMFKPATRKPEWFWFQVLKGEPADVDELLRDFTPDLSTTPLPSASKGKRDPFEIDGPVGAFNRAYEDFQELIDVYELPYDVAGADRWVLQGATAAAGMGLVTPGLVYSHHANDPAYGETCSAFDLARLHLFGHLDEDLPAGTPINRRPSNTAMTEVAMKDVRVLKEIIGNDFGEVMEDIIAQDSAESTGDWRLGMHFDSKTGKPRDEIHNWDLITANDPAFKVMYYNEMSLAIEISDDLPWRPRGTRVTFDSGDRSGLALYIERTYNIRPARAYLDDLINDRALPRRVNPVKDYLVKQKWDGVPRVETCLPGVRPTKFTRLVARKAMVAAVARMMDPGIKWDHMIVLYGPEGLGKSYWIDRLALGFSSNLTKISDKDTLITMQRSWIMTADEGHSMRKADWDAQKEFITRTADVFRMPYDRESQVHKRHTVIWGTTNEESFLKKQEGNRRFLIVRCEDKVDFEALTDEYISQVWAEAVHLWKLGETLYLTDEESRLAASAREEFTEEDPLSGMISEFLEREVAADWDTMPPDARASWLQMADSGMKHEDTAVKRLDKVCSIQIWVEALGRRRGEAKRMDLTDIANALKAMPGWRMIPGRHRIPGYGPQLVFERIDGGLL